MSHIRLKCTVSQSLATGENKTNVVFAPHRTIHFHEDNLADAHIEITAPVYITETASTNDKFTVYAEDGSGKFVSLLRIDYSEAAAQDWLNGDMSTVDDTYVADVKGALATAFGKIVGNYTLLTS